MKNRVKIKITIVLFLLSPFTANAKNLYVDSASIRGKCNDSRTYDNNDIKHPFCTIQNAANLVNPGDTVIVKDGTYTDTNSDNNVVYISRSGTASNWITFRAENKWGAVLNGASIGILSTANYIRIEDFEIKNNSGTGVHIANGAHDNYLFRLKIHDIGRTKCTGCNTTPCLYGRDGVFTGHSPTPVNNITVDSSLFYNIGRLPNDTYCDVDYNHDHALYLCGSYNTVINNIFYDNTAGWSVLFASYVDTTGHKIINNTFYNSTQRSDLSGQIIVKKTVQDAIINNNISHSAKGGFVWFYNAAGNANIVINNNLVYAGGGNLTACDGSCPATYTSSGNITGRDPKFENLTDRDFRLKTGSPAIGRGKAVGAPQYDHDKRSRQNDDSCDIGAYGFK